jgi:hypothetical protein
MHQLEKISKVLSEEYSIKKTRFNENKKLFVWAAIPCLEQLYFNESRENIDCYEEILDACLTEISKIILRQVYLLIRQRYSTLSTEEKRLLQ